MNILHKIIDVIFTRHPRIKEFCHLALPLKTVTHENMFNSSLWDTYLLQHPNVIGLLPHSLDKKSIHLVKRLLKRRKSERYFLSISEIISYYKAQSLVIPYYFPNNGTLLKSVFYYKSGTQYISPTYSATMRNRIAIDGGPASGDSSIVLLTCGAKKIFAFEPSLQQQCEIKQVFAQNKLTDKIKIIPLALSDKKQMLNFKDQYNTNYETYSTTIDEYCKNEDVGCIKLDIEGEEFPTLRGAVETIARCRPILLICVYHRPEDLFEMPNWLREKFPFYHFCLRDTEPGNRSVGVHLTLIAWPISH